MASTFCTTQEGPANALALNKDYTQVVIAGRNVFKVFNIKDDEFNEHCNLRVGKNLNLNFSCNDVAWNTNDDTVLATAATNGAVVVWNLNKQGRSKQDHVFNDHTRTVNKVNFHPTEAPLLISGSQDGTMKCFDLRTKEVIKTFLSNTESVRDVQFSPHHSQTFAAVSENGNVQLWDIRKSERCVQAYTAHSGPIFACDWHPEIPWLATASRDKTIKVWDLSGNKPTLEHTIHTIASVGHVKWRPQRKYHLASCALVVDCSINVWDVRRPYIPFASFDEHKDVATGIAWKGDPHCFLSTSRDNTLYRHMFSDASRPASRANIQGISLNNRGDIIFACKMSTSPSVAVNNKISGLMRKTSINSDNFHQAASSIHRFTNQETSQSSAFYQCATKYILDGKSLTEICDHNAKVAKAVNKSHVSVLWNVIKTLYGNDINTLTNKGREDSSNLSNNNIPKTINSGGNTINIINDQLIQSFENISMNGDRGAETPSNGGGACSDDTENEDNDSNHYLSGLTNLTSYQPGALAPRGDFIFGENELDNEFDRISSGVGPRVIPIETVDPQDWALPIEAFPLRHELHDRSPPPEQYPNHSLNHQSNHISPDMNDMNNTPTVAVEDQPSSLLSVISVPKFVPWDPSNFVADSLKYHALISDVQTAVSVLLVLGDYRPNCTLLDESIQEQWVLGYLDQLARHRLWNVSSKVIKLSWIPNISQLNQQSTTIHTFCGKCNKPLHRSGWLCDRCHSTDAALCSVCHQIVKGLYMWCQGCSHGGHLSHIKQWMTTNKVCPTGCGHACEYS